MHADGLGDLGDGVLPLAVRAGRGVHAADRGRLAVVQLGLAAAGAAAGPGGRQALAGTLDDELALELIDRAEDVEGQPPGGCGCIDLLLQDDQADAALAQLVGQREQVLERPHRAGQPGDDEKLNQARHELTGLQEQASIAILDGSAGLIERLDALDQLTTGSTMLSTARLLLMMFFLVIDLLPIIIRTQHVIGPKGTYEKILELQERADIDNASRHITKQLPTPSLRQTST